MSMRTLKECRDYAEHVISGQFVATKKMMDDCQFINQNGKHCGITTNESCKGCKFYSPNHAAKLKTLANDNLDMKNRAEKAEAQAAMMENIVDETMEKSCRTCRHKTRAWYEEPCDSCTGLRCGWEEA